MDSRNLAPMVDDANAAILLAADLIERLVSASTKWQKEERLMMLRKVDEIRALATPETREDA